LRGLVEHPEAFTSSAEQESARPLRWSQDRLEPDRLRPHDFFLGAFATGMLVGIVGLQGRYRPKERHNATVVGMDVAPEAAGTGVGRALMQELLQQVTALQGLEQLDLTVTDGNDRARALYTHCGFTVWGSLPRAVKVGERYFAKLHMCRQLR
jgi:ribosomal protein S18 acetylase RimI-like enzyme